MHSPHEETFSHRWGPGILTALPMLAAYVGLAIMAPAMLGSTTRFFLSLSMLSIGVSLIIALIGRAAGMYAANAQRPNFNAARQGTCATQLALLLSWPIFAALGIEHSIIEYVVAYFLVGAIGRTTFSLIVRQTQHQAGITSEIALRHTAPNAPQLDRSGPAQVAPRWLRRTARVCFVLGLLALARLAIDGEMTFLWVGLALLAFALIVPSLAVALGFGRDEEAA